MSSTSNLLSPSIDFSVQELFYDQVYTTLDENGYYFFRTSRIILIRMGDYLVGSTQSLLEVQKEVSETYFNNKFKNADTYTNHN